MELLVIAKSGLGEYGGFFGQVIFCEHFQFFPHIIIYKTRQLHEKAGHATPCRHLEPKSLPASMKNKAKEKGVGLTGLSQVSYFNLPSKSNEWHRETKRRPHLQHHVGPGVLPSPGLSSQLDKQQQGGNNAWQLNLGTKETLNQLEGLLEPESNWIHRDEEYPVPERAGAGFYRWPKVSQGQVGDGLDLLKQTVSVVGRRWRPFMMHMSHSPFASPRSFLCPLLFSSGSCKLHFPETPTLFLPVRFVNLVWIKGKLISIAYENFAPI